MLSTDQETSQSRGRRPLDRRDRYLDAALRLFSEHGFVGTSTDMLVAEVGGSKATLYRYFPSKEDLIAGLMDRVAAMVGDDVEDPAASDAPLEEELTAMAYSACRGVWSQEAALVLRLALGEYGRFPELARTIWEHGPAITYERFHRFVAERGHRGEIDVPDAQIAGEHFLGGLVGHQQLKIAFGMAERPSGAAEDARVREAVATFLARYETSRHRESRSRPD